MDIVPALGRCFEVHTDAEASARYARLITGAINTLWRTHFSDNTEIKSVPVKVVDHAAARIGELRKLFSDLQYQSEQDKKDRRDAIEHLRASERARKKLHIALNHCKGQMKLAPKDRRPDFGLLTEADEAGKIQQPHDTNRL